MLYNNTNHTHTYTRTHTHTHTHTHTNGPLLDFMLIRTNSEGQPLSFTKWASVGLHLFFFSLSHVFWCLQSHLHDKFWKYFHFPADKDACPSDCFRSPHLRRRRKRRRNPRAMTATERLVLPWTGRWEAAGVKVSVDFEKNYVKVRTEWAEMFGKY